jgi:hypothetical protein
VAGSEEMSVEGWKVNLVKLSPVIACKANNIPNELVALGRTGPTDVRKCFDCYCLLWQGTMTNRQTQKRSG